MSSNLVIAAIPDENDRVWKVSSEKIPHLTILFLGDSSNVSNLEQIMLFVEHAANTTLKRFYLPVDRRGELGDDKADVLFFKKGRYDYKAVRDFRAALLQDANIKTAYDSAQQFDGSWTPHLTLGYPETPAKPESDDYAGSFYEVCFNKIAVWTGDFEGPDFLLKDYWDEMEDLDISWDQPVSVGMSALVHAAKVSDTPWSQFKTSDYTDEQYARACLLDRGENAGTAKERYGIPVREPDGTLNRNACHAAASVLSSKGGTGTARGNKVKGSSEQIATAKNKLVALYKGPLDEDVPKGLGGEDSVKQTTDLGSEFVLEHHGVKGMRWGQRKTDVGGAAKSVGRAAKSTGGAVGKAAKATSRFVKDVQFENRVESGAAREAVIGAANKDFRGKDLPAIKNKPEHQKAAKLKNRLRNPLDPGTKAYRAEVKQAYIKRLETTANSMQNASGNRQYTIRERGIEQPAEGGRLPASKYFWEVSSRAVTHAEGDDFTLLEVVMDDDGFITDLKKAENLAQTADLGADFLAHYGVKGMHWGQRRAAPAAVATAARSVVPHGAKRKTKIETQGGENHEAAPDAIKVAQHKAKLKKSGTAALSNAELREVANRLQLEQQVKQLSKHPGQKFVGNLLKQQGQQEAQGLLRKGREKAFA